MAEDTKKIPTGEDGVKIAKRTLPNYVTRAEAWDFMIASYLGGKSYIESHLFKYYIEGDDEFKERKTRAHRENHCKRIVDLFNSYLFQEQPTRDTIDARLKQFHENVDGKGKRIDKFMKGASLWSSVFGRIYIMVDKPSLPDSEKTGTAADNINPKAQPYCYLIHPQDIKDIAFNEDGSVKWVIIVEHVRDDDDPFTSDGEVKDQFRLWTMDGWYLFDDKGNHKEDGEHGLGIVPLIILDSEEGDPYDGQSLIGDIAYLDRAIFNNWSRLDAIVCDQTFSQLIFPIEGLVGDIATDQKLMEKFMSIATNRFLFYSVQAQTPPAWISPDASQAQFILDMIESQTKQLYSSLGLKAEVGTETVSQSGTAKAWDFDKLNKMLADKADNLEAAEVEINRLFAKWIGQEDIKCAVDYPEKFDTRSLMDEIAIVQELALIRISDTFTKEVEKLLAMKALPKIDEATLKKIMKEIDDKDLSAEEASQGATFPFDETEGTSNASTQQDGKTQVGS